jgi:cellulose biosynthesis protein BcsQ
MAVIATINRKGGCGKTTLATHLAVSFERRSQRVMLVDVDFQQSALRWLKRRREQVDLFEFAHSCAEACSLQRPPSGVSHTLVDTPGSVRGYELAKLLVFSDLVLIPVCDSIFDYEGSEDCIAEMRKHPKVAKGRVKFAVVGMRIRPGSEAEQRAHAWAARMAIPYLGSVRRSSLYVQSAATGLTVFDLAAGETGQAELADWRLVTARLDGLMSQHAGEIEAGKLYARRRGSTESTFGESSFGTSTYGPVQRVTQQVSLVSRSTGAQRPAADLGLLGRLLRSLPHWRSRRGIRRWV